MPAFESHRRTPVSQALMFETVADIEKYPAFLPFCENLIIIDKRQEQGQDVILADMTVAYGKLRETFRSRVVLNEAAAKITTTNVDGPFRHLLNVWHFNPLGEAQTEVHFQIDYEFKSRLLGALMGGLFDKAFHTYAESFEKRAIALQNAQT